MGNEEFRNKFQKKLQSDLKELFVPFKERNDFKRQIEELGKTLAVATATTIGAIALGKVGWGLGALFQRFQKK